MTPELLAPAGSPESLLAALRCGADAVYVGATAFSARQNAANFDAGMLREAASLCHLYGARLYLAVNTLLFDTQLAEFAQWIETAADCGIDACIVQDLGALSIIRQTVPALPIHASTQMSIHTVSGVLQAKALGMTRVVAARELSLSALQALADTGVAIEAFVHGALCMSVSGQCYYSAMIGSRSANRGRCAQACRLPFTAAGNASACALSLKDLCLVSQIDALRNAGIASLKIEGRMKRPEYVAAAVTAYRQALDGGTPDLDQLRSIFSRSGFTDGYFTGTRKQMFGVRSKEDVVAAKDVFPALQALYHKPRKVAEIHADLQLQVDKPAVLSLRDTAGSCVTVSGEVPQQATSAPIDTERATRQLSKLGDTIYTLRTVSLTAQDGLMLPASALNALRRDAVAALDRARIAANQPQYACCPYLPDTSPKAAEVPSTIRVQVTHAAQLSCLPANAYTYALLPIAEVAKVTLPKERIILVPPRFVSDEAALVAQLRDCYAQGYRALLCENLAQLTYGKAIGFRLHGGFGLNVTNSATVHTLQALELCDCTASFELKLSQLAARHGDFPCGILAYGRLPLMLLRNCPIRNEVGCKSCPGALTDRTGRKFPIRCCGDYVELLNCERLYLADKPASKAAAAFRTLCFYEEDAETVARIVAAHHDADATKPPTGTTNGLYFRGVF